MCMVPGEVTHHLLPLAAQGWSRATQLSPQQGQPHAVPQLQEPHIEAVMPVLCLVCSCQYCLPVERQWPPRPFCLCMGLLQQL